MWLLALPMVLVGWGCGDSGGGEITSEAQFQAVMEAIGLDFAQVLADVAPDSSAAFAVKGIQASSADCPDGGSAVWEASSGSLGLSACTIRGVILTGSLFGFISADVGEGFGNLSANLSGQLMVSGGAMADLNVQNLIVSAALPIADESTFWRIEAFSEDGDFLCAWSGGGPCQDEIF